MSATSYASHGTQTTEEPIFSKNKGTIATFDIFATVETSANLYCPFSCLFLVLFDTPNEHVRLRPLHQTLYIFEKNVFFYIFDGFNFAIMSPVQVYRYRILHKSQKYFVKD